MRLRSFVVALLFGLTIQTSKAAVPPPLEIPGHLSLAQAIQLVRERGLDLLLAETAQAAAEADVRSAGAVPNPGWSLGLYRSFYDSNQFETPWGFYVGLTDSGAIADLASGKRGLRKQVANAALEVAKLGRADAQRMLEFLVKRQYVEAVLAGAAESFSRDVVIAATRTYELNQLRFDKGAISESDVAKAETAKLEAEQAADVARQNLRQEKVNLAFLVGARSLVPDYTLDLELLKFRVPPYLDKVNRQELLSSAREHRPDLLIAERSAERARAAGKLAHRNRFPDLALNVQYAQQGSASPPTVAGMQQQTISPPTLQVGLSGSLPVAYQQQGEIRRAQADLDAADLQHAKIEAQIVSDVEDGMTAFQSSRRRVERMESRLLDRARRTRDLVELQHQKGSASLLEYLDAQRVYISANLEYLQDLTTYWTAVFQLEQAVGVELR